MLQEIRSKLLLARRFFQGYPRRFASTLSAIETASSFLVSIPKTKPKQNQNHLISMENIINSIFIKRHDNCNYTTICNFFIKLYDRCKILYFCQNITQLLACC